MKLWNKGTTTEALILDFTVGNDRELDLKLAKYDIQGSIAHARMLNEIKIITDEEIALIIPALDKLLKEVASGSFTIEEEFEDVHSKVEFALTEMVGECGKKIHTARSRNDQVLVDLHLYAKDELQEIKELISSLFNTLMDLAETHKEEILPGYTHTQVAMPSSFGLWFSAYAECLIDDLQFVNAALKIADQNPLGSAAGFGSSFPIDRERTTELLGFSELKVNSVAAQMSRGKLEKSVAFALASISGTLSKLSADICLYMCQNFGFIGFPKHLTTGSSIMPHKHNPDVFELVRAKSNQIQNLPAEIGWITNNLTSGYHRDFQQLKEAFMNGLDSVKQNLEVTYYMLQHIEIKSQVKENDMYDDMYSVERLNELVIQGQSFREAYKQVGNEIESGTYTANKMLDHTHIGSLGNLRLDLIKAKHIEVQQ